MKSRRRSRHAASYFSFFSLACRSRILAEEVVPEDLESVSQMWMSKTVPRPRLQKQWARTSPLASSPGVLVRLDEFVALVAALVAVARVPLP